MQRLYVCATDGMCISATKGYNVIVYQRATV